MECRSHEILPVGKISQETVFKDFLYGKMRRYNNERCCAFPLSPSVLKIVIYAAFCQSCKAKRFDFSFMSGVCVSVVAEIHTTFDCGGKAF